MPLDDRDYIRGKHPPSCTCRECTEKRLGRYFKEPHAQEPPQLGMTEIPPIENVSYSNKEFPPILIPIILIFSCTLIGFGISMFIGNFTPFWGLLTFSVIYSIEKWGRKTTRNRAIGIPYRLFLNVMVLSILGYTIWFGITLFSQRLQFSPIVSSLLLIGELVFSFGYVQLFPKIVGDNPI